MAVTSSKELPQGTGLCLEHTHTHKHKRLNDARHHNAHKELEVLGVQESIEPRKRVIRSPLESSFFRGALRPQKP